MVDFLARGVVLPFPRLHRVLPASRTVEIHALSKRRDVSPPVGVQSPADSRRAARGGFKNAPARLSRRSASELTSGWPHAPQPLHFPNTEVENQWQTLGWCAKMS